MAVGTQFGSYTLKRKLARGGMADIFLATRRVDGAEELCVIKMMIPLSLRNPRALRLFLGEARLAAQLEHANIVRILDRDRVDDYYFIAMEYIPGETLYHLIYQAAQVKRPIRPSEAAAIIVQACEGLAYAHSMSDPSGKPMNLVHRDISPSNLILSYQGQVKILDFGIAAADTRRLTFPKGKAVGKYGYMSPEQCRGADVDQRSDIFSMGVVFWELLTGASLFPGRDPKAILASIQAGGFPPPSEVQAEIPTAIDRVVLRALGLAPKERFADARAMGQAIREACIDTALPSQADLGQAMIELFGRRRAKLSSQGEVGEELELATLLFDDLEAQPPNRPRDQPRSVKRRSNLSRSTMALLVLAVVLIGSALGFAAWVKSDWHLPADPAPIPRPSRGLVLVESTPSGARIRINGQDTNKVTPSILREYPLHRELRIELEHAGYEKWAGRVLLEDEELRRIHAMLISDQVSSPDPPPRQEPARKRKTRNTHKGRSR